MFDVIATKRLIKNLLFYILMTVNTNYPLPVSKVLLLHYINPDWLEKNCFAKGSHKHGQSNKKNFIG